MNQHSLVHEQPPLPHNHARYDSNGNTLTKTDSSGTTTYAWDFENRLSSVTLPGSGGTVSFKYDPFGRRIYRSSSGGTSIYAYDSDNENLIEEANPSGSAVARYLQTEDIDTPLALQRSGATSYYQADGLGSTTSLSATSGALANAYAYDSFGRTTASSGTITNPSQHSARELDSDTSLYYYRAREYDPSVGRFLSEDPTGFSAGINFYAYVRNRPVDFRDPTGLYTLKGFTPDQEVEMVRAILLIRRKLEEKCPSCVTDPSLRKKLLGYLGYLNDGTGQTFVFSKEKLGPGYCGQTRGVAKKTFIADWKTTPGCGCLPSTIIHELVHDTFGNIMTRFNPWGDDEKKPNSIDGACFPNATCNF